MAPKPQTVTLNLTFTIEPSVKGLTGQVLSEALVRALGGGSASSSPTPEGHFKPGALIKATEIGAKDPEVHYGILVRDMLSYVEIRTCNMSNNRRNLTRLSLEKYRVSEMKSRANGMAGLILLMIDQGAAPISWGLSLLRHFTEQRDISEILKRVAVLPHQHDHFLYRRAPFAQTALQGLTDPTLIEELARSASGRRLWSIEGIPGPLFKKLRAIESRNEEAYAYAFKNGVSDAVKHIRDTTLLSKFVAYNPHDEHLWKPALQQITSRRGFEQLCELLVEQLKRRGERDLHRIAGAVMARAKELGMQSKGIQETFALFGDKEALESYSQEKLRQLVDKYCKYKHIARSLIEKIKDVEQRKSLARSHRISRAGLDGPSDDEESFVETADYGEDD